MESIIVFPPNLCPGAQVFILDSLAGYTARDAKDAESIVERVTPRLQHANCAVVLSAVKARAPTGCARPPAARAPGLASQAAPWRRSGRRELAEPGHCQAPSRPGQGWHHERAYARPGGGLEPAGCAARRARGRPGGAARAQVVLKQMGMIEDQALRAALTKKMAPPLVTLLSGEPEIQYVALRNISLIVQQFPQILSHEVKVRRPARAGPLAARACALRQCRPLCCGCARTRTERLRSQRAAKASRVAARRRHAAVRHRPLRAAWLPVRLGLGLRVPRHAGLLLQVQRPDLRQDGEAGDHDRARQRPQHRPGAPRVSRVRHRGRRRLRAQGARPPAAARCPAAQRALPAAALDTRALVIAGGSCALSALLHPRINRRIHNALTRAGRAALRTPGAAALRAPAGAAAGGARDRALRGEPGARGRALHQRAAGADPDQGDVRGAGGRRRHQGHLPSLPQPVRAPVQAATPPPPLERARSSAAFQVCMCARQQALSARRQRGMPCPSWGALQKQAQLDE